MLGYGIGIVLVVLALWILAIATGWALPFTLTSQGLAWLQNNPWESVVIAAVLLILGLLLFMRPRHREELSFVTTAKWGEVRVTEEALREIITRSAMNIEGVRQVQPLLRQRQDGLEITVSSSLEPNSVIPATSEQLQERLKQDVQHYTGIIVAEVRVLVRSLEPSPARIR